MVIAPDRSGTGTNALLVSAQGPFEFRFGERSFERHLLLAEERGWRVSRCPRPELEFDLDTPNDFAAWAGRMSTAS
jgi:2-phospho-L-lactate guanylyltransferase